MNIRQGITTDGFLDCKVPTAGGWLIRIVGCEVLSIGHGCLQLVWLGDEPTRGSR